MIITILHHVRLFFNKLNKCQFSLTGISAAAIDLLCSVIHCLMNFHVLTYFIDTQHFTKQFFLWSCPKRDWRIAQAGGIGLAAE